jgi:sterol desaturase/sphingolipid hydroxylase (fatty acid hydroxylase superfamily)
MMRLDWTTQLILAPLALVYVNFIEWWFHKYVLHGLGKKRGSIWNFHWQHHLAVKRHGFLDPDYQNPFTAWKPQSKEIVALLGGGVAHLPVLFVAPLVYAALVWGGLRYYYVHRKSHLDIEWAKRTVPWHYDHHMNRDMESNWCVTRPWFDLLFGTRKLADRST